MVAHRFSPLANWALTLVLSASGCTAPPSTGHDAGSDAGSGGGVDAGSDGGIDAGGDGGGPPLEGPLPLLDRLSPSRNELDARSYEDIFLVDETWGALADVGLPGGFRLRLDPTDTSGGVPICVRWGILTSGTMRLPTVQQSLDFIGEETLVPPGLARQRVQVQSCGFDAPTTPCTGGPGDDPECRDIYQCPPNPSCRAFSPSPGSGARTPEDVTALVEELPEVRLLHPYMIAYPCDPDTGEATVRTDSAAIFPSQFATTGSNGMRWASGVDAAPEGDNDVVGALETWHLAWEVAARHEAFVIWLGDVSFPRRWYPAADRTPTNPLGIRCGPEETGWRNANDFTGLQLFAMHVGARAMGEQPLPDEFLATFSAMPYMRAMSTAATALQRFAERHHPSAPVPRRFSTSGASKSGMGCIYTVLGDPRIEHGACAVFDAFDTSTSQDMMHRMVSDWGLCGGYGINQQGCVTGNFPGFPGPQSLAVLEGDGVGYRSFRKTWELGQILSDMDRSVPRSRLFLLNGSTDFHWSVGSNETMWRERPPPAEQVWLLHRMNADHGMAHLAPDDGPEGLSFRDWTHGVQKTMAYRAFFEARTPLQIVFTEPPRIEGRRILARARVMSPRPIGGVQAWVAASTDRDFSFCTGIELPSDAMLCRGEFVCPEPEQRNASYTAPVCPAAHLSEECGIFDAQPKQLRTTAREKMPLPTRRSAGHFCWWKWSDPSDERPAWLQCLDPRDEVEIAEATFPADTLLREVRGTFSDLLAFDDELPGRAPLRPPLPSDPLPPTYRFRHWGATRADVLMANWHFVDPYERDATGEYQHWASGFFVPRPATLEDDGTVVFEWEIPAGADVDNFAVALEAWDADGDPPDVVYTPILTVSLDASADTRVCGD